MTSKKQHCVSVRGATYDRLAAYCRKNNIPVSQLIETLVCEKPARKKKRAPK